MFSRFTTDLSKTLFVMGAACGVFFSVVDGSATPPSERTAQSLPATPVPRLSDSVLTLLTQSVDPLIRESAAQVLGLRGDTSAVMPLIDRLSKDDNIWVRARAAESLGRIGSRQAVDALRTALSREKQERIRRIIAIALLRLGQRSAFDELLWQLKAGTNHTKAEVMEQLVQLTAEPLGQNPEAWWGLLSTRGAPQIAARPAGRPSIWQLGTPQISGPALASWRLVTLSIVKLPPSAHAVTKQALQHYEKTIAPLPADGILVIKTNFRAPNPVKTQPDKDGGINPMSPGPGLTYDAAQYLLKQSPRLIGIGVDVAQIDPPNTVKEKSAYQLLITHTGSNKSKLLILEHIEKIDTLNPRGHRALLIEQTNTQSKTPDTRRNVLLLAVLPN